MEGLVITGSALGGLGALWMLDHAWAAFTASRKRAKRAAELAAAPPADGTAAGNASPLASATSGGVVTPRAAALRHIASQKSLRYSSIAPGTTALDTSGVLVQSWRATMHKDGGGGASSSSSSSMMGGGDASYAAAPSASSGLPGSEAPRVGSNAGWYNLGVVVMASWLAINAIRDVHGFEAELWGRGKWLGAQLVAMQDGGLLWFTGLLAAAVAGSYCLTRLLHATNALTLKAEFAIFVAVDFALIIAAALMVRWWAGGWSVIARVAFGMEAAVLMMKVHSYNIASALLRRGVTYLFTSPAMLKKYRSEPGAGGATPDSGDASPTPIITLAPLAPPVPPTTPSVAAGAAALARAGKAAAADVDATPTPAASTPPAQPAAYAPNLSSFVLFMLAPTLSFEPVYPRTRAVRWTYVIEKACLAVCLLLAGGFVAHSYARPAFVSVNMDSASQLVDTFLRLLLPTLGMCVILFFLVFEAFLNGAAELTRFGARAFYRPWWNSTTFLEFSRTWNRPVHDWMHRHLYVDLQYLFSVRQPTSMAITFVVSIVMHELLIWAALTPVTPVPVLALLSCAQFPLMRLMATVKGTVLGNLLFWTSLEVGVALVLALYGRQYCAAVTCAI